MLSWLSSKHIDDTARYHQTGRRYRGLTDDQPREQWKTAMARMAADILDEAARSADSSPWWIEYRRDVRVR